jgi:hypothetical protein
MQPDIPDRIDTMLVLASRVVETALTSSEFTANSSPFANNLYGTSRRTELESRRTTKSSQAQVSSADSKPKVGSSGAPKRVESEMSQVQQKAARLQQQLTQVQHQAEQAAQVHGKLDSAARVDKLLSDLKIKVEGADQEMPAADQLAELVNILPGVSRSGTPHLLSVAEVTAAALTNPNTSPTLGKKLVGMLRGHIWLYRLVGYSAPMATGLGLFIFFCLFLVLTPIFLDSLLINLAAGIDAFLGVPLSVLILIGMAGALGSIVSVMTRIDGSVFKEGTAGPQAYAIIGLTKPIVGAAFALFVFALLQSPLVPLDIPQPSAEDAQNTAGFLYLALAFVAGFSERFATGLATRAEQSTGR